jgi:hypothetical protein
MTLPNSSQIRNQSLEGILPANEVEANSVTLPTAPPETMQRMPIDEYLKKLKSRDVTSIGKITTITGMRPRKAAQE